MRFLYNFLYTVRITVSKKYAQNANNPKNGLRFLTLLALAFFVP